MSILALNSEASRHSLVGVAPEAADRVGRRSYRWVLITLDILPERGAMTSTLSWWISWYRCRREWFVDWHHFRRFSINKKRNTHDLMCDGAVNTHFLVCMSGVVSHKQELENVHSCQQLPMNLWPYSATTVREKKYKTIGTDWMIYCIMFAIRNLQDACAVL